MQYMKMLKTIGVFLGWLSGSLAGIAACFYAFGYLVTLANLHRLGLDVYLFRYDPSFYMSRGASFFLYVTIFTVIVSLILLPFAAAIMVTKFWVDGRLAHGDAKTLLNRLARIANRHAGKWRGLAFVILLVPLAWQLVPRFFDLTQLLLVTDLLYGPAAADPDVSDVQPAFSQQNLDRKFDTAVLGFLGAGGLLYLAWHMTAPFRLHYLMIAPFLLVFALYGSSLPLIYGVAKILSQFSQISIVRDEGEQGGAPESLFLLNKTDQEFLLWDPGRKTVLWLPVSGVVSARIGQQVPIADTSIASEEPET